MPSKRSQQAMWDSQRTPHCPWCGQEDTKFHRYFSCAATATVRAPFQFLMDELNTLDTLWPELPVLFVSPEEDFRTVFQFALHEHEPDPHLVSEIQQSADFSQPLHVYTDGSCQRPRLPSLRFAGYSERCWQAQRFKETGELPTTLHVILQELCPREENIHHAELRALVRAQELFRYAIIHTDSSAAISTFSEAVHCLAGALRKHPQPGLCNRICNIQSALSPQSGG